MIQKNRREIATKTDRRSLKRRKVAQFKTDNRRSIRLIAKQSVQRRK